MWVIVFAKPTDAVLTHLPLLALAVTLFVSTNIDDLVVLIGFFADRRLRTRDIVAGQYAGLALLFVVSTAASLFSLVVPKAYLGLLGVFPIVIGVRKWIEHQNDGPESENSSHGSIAGVALVTIANGGDNLGIYIPTFAVHSGGEVAVIAVVFAAMTAVWCALAHWMVNHRRLGMYFRRYGHILAPLVLIGLGISIIYNAGSIEWLLHRWGHSLKTADSSLRQDLSRKQLAACVADDACESARKLTDPCLLPSHQGFFRNQLRSNAQRGGAGQNEIGSRLLIHSAGRNQRHLGEGDLQGPNVAVSAHLRAREDLDEVNPGFPCHDHLCGRQNAGENNNFVLQREVHDLQNEAGTGEEPSPGIDTTMRRFLIQNRPRAHDHVWMVRCQISNHIDCPGNGHRDFRDGDAGVIDRFGSVIGVV
jgi:cadmium resistance protein CadD (predicted permease)